MAFDYEQALANATQPVRDYSRGMTALTLADIARKEHLQDVASERAYEQKSADVATTRRVQEFDQMETVKLAQSLATMGVDTTDEKGNLLPRNRLLTNYKEFQKTKAENLLAHFDTQLKDNRDSQDEVAQQLLASSAKGASAEAKQQAVIAVLNDPLATKYMDADQLARLRKAASATNPEQTIQQIYGELAEGTFSRTGNAKRAAPLLTTYTTALASTQSDEKKMAQATLSARLGDLMREGQGITAARDRHVLDFAPFLPKEVVTGQNKSKPPPPPPPPAPPGNPNDAFPDDTTPEILPTDRTGGSLGLTPDAIQNWKPTPDDPGTLGPIPTARTNRFANRAQTNGASNGAMFDLPPMPSGGYGRLRMPVIAATAAAPRPTPGGLPTLQPGEEEKIRSLAPALGISSADFEAGDQRLKAIAAGDPVQPADKTLIDTFSMLVNLVRQPQSMARPGAGVVNP